MRFKTLTARVGLLGGLTLSALAFVGTAHSAVMTYTDPAAFHAALPGVGPSSTLDFESQSPGDVVLPLNRYIETPVTMRIEAGFIEEIEGGLDAEFLSDYLEGFGDREVFRTSHIGFGVHPAAQWNALSFYDRRETMGMDARCFRGGFLFSTGPNRFTGRYVDAHLDIPMRGCTVTLDGGVVAEGTPISELTLPDGIAELEIHPASLPRAKTA